MASNDPQCKCAISHITPHRRSKCTLTNNKPIANHIIRHVKSGNTPYDSAEAYYEFAKWVYSEAIPKICHNSQQASPAFYNYSITKYLGKYCRDKEQLEAHHFNVSCTHHYFFRTPNVVLFISCICFSLALIL